jgi:hypothetical protein
MLTRRFLFVAALLALPCMSMAWATDVSENPVLVDPWISGDAKDECGRTNCDATFAYKFDDWDVEIPSGSYLVDGGNFITIDNVITIDNEAKSFDWESDYPVCAVIVKGGTGANVYYYNGAYGDTGLVAPGGKGISHVTFCYNDPDLCYQENSAWTSGPRYVNKGNWAMYSSRSELESGVVIIADGGSNPTNVGTAKLIYVNGTPTIDIVLTGGAIFYYDVNDPLYDDNLKVQDYEYAPKRAPSPGQFAWKAAIAVGATQGSIVVPENNFYGIHLDVAILVPCP